MMTKEQIEQLIEILENVRHRPGIYIIGGVTLALAWENGFHRGLSLSKGSEYEYYSAAAYVLARRDRGWLEEMNNFPGYLQAHGLNNDEIINELLSIQIEAWKKHLQEIDEFDQGASQREQVNTIIQALEAVRQNPTQYLYGETELAPATFLSGLHEGLMLFGAIQEQAHVPLFEQVKRERGWTEETPDFFHYLKNERGFSDQDATTELLTIEIEAWKKRLAEMEARETPPS
jgi:hypothetical protein